MIVPSSGSLQPKKSETEAIKTQSGGSLTTVGIEHLNRRHPIYSIPKVGWIMLVCTFLLAVLDHRLKQKAISTASYKHASPENFRNFLLTYQGALGAGVLLGAASDVLLSRKILVSAVLIITTCPLFSNKLYEMSFFKVINTWTVQGVFRVLLIESSLTYDENVIRLYITIAKTVEFAGRAVSWVSTTIVAYYLTTFPLEEDVMGLILVTVALTLMLLFVRVPHETVPYLMWTLLFRQFLRLETWKLDANEPRSTRHRGLDHLTFRNAKRLMNLSLLIVPVITAYYVVDCSMFIFRGPFSFLRNGYQVPSLHSMDLTKWILSMMTLPLFCFVVLPSVSRFLKRPLSLTSQIILTVVYSFMAYIVTVVFLIKTVHYQTGPLPIASTSQIRFINTLNTTVTIVPKDKAYASHWIEAGESYLINYVQPNLESTEEELFEIELHDKFGHYSTFVAMKLEHTTVYLIWKNKELRRVEGYEPLMWTSNDNYFLKARVYFANLHEAQFVTLLLTPHSLDYVSHVQGPAAIKVPSGRRIVVHIAPGTYFMSFDNVDQSKLVTFERKAIYGIVYYTQLLGLQKTFHDYTVLNAVKAHWMLGSLFEWFCYSSCFFVMVEFEVFLFHKAPLIFRGFAFAVLRFLEEGPFILTFVFYWRYYGINIDSFFEIMAGLFYIALCILTLSIVTKFRVFFRN